ncbi:hypothetical protein SAMN05216358_0096 [Rhizobium sp. AN5]|uniref:hypothetical protein n=1 Tax=Rhizobium sp. AN5 TaxID=1855304 RepID=UPI000BCD3642|nr:hypothetical protein [Rhizobium sp. AN5]SOC90077.1 hypothetical protein SAMN05216358_0096 [Rhizobium sp. AN5]
MQIEFTEEQLDLVISAVICRLCQAKEGPENDPAVADLIKRLDAEKERLFAERGRLRSITPTDTIALTGPERDTVIAALRLWQDNSMIPPALVEIACNGRVQGLTDDEIDILIEEKINV